MLGCEVQKEIGNLQLPLVVLAGLFAVGHGLCKIMAVGALMRGLPHRRDSFCIAFESVLVIGSAV